VPAPGDGVLWLLPNFGGNDFSLDPRGHVFTAGYGATPIPAPWRPTPPPTATPAPTAAVTQGPALSWQSIPAAGVSGLAIVAPSDGNILYACALDQSSLTAVPHIWISRDRAAHWSTGAAVPSQADASNCQIVVDANDPQRLAASLSYMPPGAGGGPDPSTYQIFLSTDGARTWTAPSPHEAWWITRLASSGSTDYAIRSVLMSSLNAVTTDLYASTNGMRTWQNVSSTLTAPGGDFDKTFWLDPTIGNLLLQVEGDHILMLYASTDGGQHWAAVPGASAPFPMTPRMLSPLTALPVPATAASIGASRPVSTPAPPTEPCRVWS
jgi:hypothetical protein